MKSSQCDLNILGYTCATMLNYKKLQIIFFKFQLILKNFQSSDYVMQLVHMKMESQVIVNQHVTVNKYLSLVHTARHMQEVFFSQDSSYNAN